MDHFEKELLRNEILHADETTVQVPREDGKRAESKSYMWLYRTSQSVAHQVVLYEYASTRSKKIPLKRLESYKGYLHTDGWARCKTPPQKRRGKEPQKGIQTSSFRLR